MSSEHSEHKEKSEHNEDMEKEVGMQKPVAHDTDEALTLTMTGDEGLQLLQSDAAAADDEDKLIEPEYQSELLEKSQDGDISGNISDASPGDGGGEDGDQLLQHAIETLLFVAAEPLSTARLAEVIGVKPQSVEAAALSLLKQYENRGILLRRVAGGWQFVTAPRFSALVERLYRPKYQQLSTAAMETLAIIAYKQPITRAEVSEIRQVDSDGVITTLLDKKLVAEVGRLSGPGRAILYGTTDEFLTFFGINSLQELPELQKEKSETASDLVL